MFDHATPSVSPLLNTLDLERTSGRAGAGHAPRHMATTRPIDTSASAIGKHDERIKVGRTTHDQRSGRVVFLSHCLLNKNTRYLGGAGRPGSVVEIVNRVSNGESASSSCRALRSMPGEV